MIRETGRIQMKQFLLTFVLLFGAAGCTQSGTDKPSDKSSSKPIEKAAEEPKKTVIYDPEGMKRIHGGAPGAVLKIKDYYVNVLVVEYPVLGTPDVNFLRSLPEMTRVGAQIRAVARKPGGEALSPVKAEALRQEVLSSVSVGATVLNVSWEKSGKTVLLELTKEKTLKGSEEKILSGMPAKLVKSSLGTNGWLRLPGQGDNRARMIKILKLLAKLPAKEKTQLLIVPTYEKSTPEADAPFLYINSGDLRAEGSEVDLNPTLREALHSDGTDAEDTAHVSPGQGESLFLKYSETNEKNRVGIAYFLGGRTAIMYRAYITNKYDNSGLEVELYSKNIYDRSGKGFLTHRDYYRVPKKEVFTTNQFKATGIELIEIMMEAGNMGATIGETAFLQGIEKNVPMVAIAEVGYDSKETPGHAMVLCKNAKYEKPEDLKGKKFGSRRSAGGDEVFLREFISSIGLDPNKDVVIAGNVPDDKLKHDIRTGQLDGMYAHLMSVPKLPPHCRVIRKMDWVNSELSSALLVFPKAWLAKNRDMVKKMLRVTMEQIALERTYTKAERRNKKWKSRKGIEIEMDREDMQLPKVRQPPTVRLELLQDMQTLLRKHNVFDGKAQVKDFIDNSLVEEVAAELKLAL